MSSPPAAATAESRDTFAAADPRPDRRERALGLAYGYLNRRDRTVAEVRAHLEGKDLGAAAIDAALHELREQRVLDDARFARLFAEDKRELEQWGTDRIRRTLLSRGVERELIDLLLGGESREAELDRALALLCRRIPSPPRDRKARDRALGMLLRKGYDRELAVDALAAYASDRQSGC